MLYSLSTQGMKIKIKTTPLKDLLLIKTEYFKDQRGLFWEPWHKKHFQAAGIKLEFVQEAHSISRKNVLRGLHYQNNIAPMAKLVRCTHGKIFDVAVDLRVNSPTFAKWFGIKLTAQNRLQILIPKGFANGFLALTNKAEKQYKQTGFYTPSAEGTLAWNDPELNIDWPTKNPLLSKRDRNAINLKEYLKNPAFNNTT